MRNLKNVVITVVIVIFINSALCFAGQNMVRNGSFRIANGRGLTQENVESFRAKGLTAPDKAQWPNWWYYYGNGGSFSFPRTGGVNNDGYASISGKNAILKGYVGNMDSDFIYTVWVRGKGLLNTKCFSYGKVNGNITFLPPKKGDVKGRTSPVDTKEWVKYRYLIKITPELFSLHPVFRAIEGEIDIDEVNISPANPALKLIVAEEEKLRDAGKLLQNLWQLKADEAYWEKVKAFEKALEAFETVNKLSDKELLSSLQKIIARLKPYVTTEGISTVKLGNYNDMLILTRILPRLAASVGDK